LGILRSIESRLERVVEGSVGRLFRASVAPVELARKLAKELEEGKVVSVTQTYAPNEYTIYLSPRDRTRFADFEASLRNELASYLAEHARRAGYVMPTRPRVRFETESSLHTGIFGISTALVRDDEEALDAMTPPPAAEGAPGPAAPSAPWTPPLPDTPAVPPVAVPPVDVPPVMPPLPNVPLVPEPAPEELAVPEAEPEEPVRSPLDPDPSEPPGGFPAFPALPLDPDPVEEIAPPPFVPLLPDVPPLPRVPLPDVPTVPAVPSLPPTGEEAPAAPSPYEPRPDETMIARPQQHEELVLVHDDKRTVIDGPVLQIGRAPGCDIVLDDRNVSRRHAEVRRRGPVVVLVDLDSTNGTIVNGRRVREHPLADGDRITLGNSRLTFERRTT
jgi:pSer/pThr/pTyr-binding forkhead associated (FHA) protein